MIRRLSLVFVAAWFVLAPATLWAQDAGTASQKITGRLVTTTGEPAANGMIYAAPVGMAAPQQPSRADSSGNFKLDNLDVGLYRIWATLPGYVSADQPGISGPQYYRAGDSVTLTMVKGAVITGTVTGPNGPVVAVMVRAIRLRDGDGKPLPLPIVVRERIADDRGIYRLYGLPPGTYVVSAGGPPRFGWGMAPTPFGAEMPTYFPSATRDTASEITVRSGDETTADISYRGEPGRTISGAVSGLPESAPQFSGVSVSIIDVRDRSTVMNAMANPAANYSFILFGVADGEYEISAAQTSNANDALRSVPRRIQVRGADVDSIKLVLAAQARIEGQVVIEPDPKAGCGKRAESAPLETIIHARAYVPETKAGVEAKNSTLETPLLPRTSFVEAAPNAKGSFTLRNLAAGSYRIDAHMPASGWYLRSIAMGTAAPSTGNRNASLALARDGITLKAGERISGLTVTLTEGAANILGRVTISESKQLPTGLRVYLVPVEKENAVDVLKFFETQVESDGAFVVGNIAPGKYWLVARQVDDHDLTAAKSIRRDSAFRSMLLQEAAKSKQEITLKPCERVADYEFALSSDQQK
jgi:hypothetical protein